MDSTERARQLRKTMTDAERLLWSRLRARQLGGHKFRRQVQIGPYIADFLSHETRLIVELDGGQHGEDAAMAYDIRRTAYLNVEGYRVIRFGNWEVLKEMDRVLDVILYEIESSHNI